MDQEAERIDRYVAENPHGSLFQQITWVRVQGETSLTPFVYFWGEEEGEIKASALVRRHRLPGLGWAKDIVDRGPVCTDPDVLCEAISELAQLLQAKRSVSLKLNPYWQEPATARVEADLAGMGFRPGPVAGSLHSTTLLIDLSLEESDILRGFRNFTRQKIKKAKKMGIHVAPVKNEREVHAFCLLYEKMAVAKSTEPLAENFLARMWRELLVGKEHGLFLVSHYKGEIISGIVVLKHGTRAVYTYGTSDLEKFPKVPKSQLCHWRAIQWAKEQGCSVYDLGGYLPNAIEGSPAHGINLFKMGFSKNQVNLVRQHERIFSPGCYLLLSWLETVRKRIQ